MSAGLHSKWNRTLTWMLSAALIAQGGTVVYAGDLGDEAAVEAFLRIITKLMMQPVI